MAVYARLLMADVADVVLRRRPELTPPRRAIGSIGTTDDFEAVGRHLADVAVRLGKLSPAGSILDVGCGYGRLAVRLLDILADGEYLGFDISRDAIRWCRRNVTRRNPRFAFCWVDLYNRHYHRRGRIDPLSFAFPSADASVDVVFASSVFTHLPREVVAHYLTEAARVLRPGGRLVGSFFLLNDESRARIAAGQTYPAFTFAGDEAFADPEDPDAAVAIPEEVVKRELEAAGLALERVEYGRWCTRPDTLSYQDFVVAVSSGRTEGGRRDRATESLPDPSSGFS